MCAGPFLLVYYNVAGAGTVASQDCNLPLPEVVFFVVFGTQTGLVPVAFYFGLGLERDGENLFILKEFQVFFPRAFFSAFFF